MISAKTVQRLQIGALLSLAIYLAFVALHLFHSRFKWIEYVILGIGVTLFILSSLARMRRRAERTSVIKSTRATLLKRRWELRHKREW
jgi:hypothetical protein